MPTKNKLTKSIVAISKKSFQKTFDLIKLAYPQARCALNFNSPWELLVATILSAQCTDKRVNMVTPVLFAKFKTVNEISKANLKQIEEIIRSTGFYRNKAKNICASAKLIVKRFNSKVPDNMEDLVSLPGVARKTANVVLWNAFGKNEGIVVDTHVSRTAFRLGWTEENSPVKIENDLMKICKKSDWGMLSHYLIDLGRDVCKAPKPRCQSCKLKSICPWYKNIISKNE